MKPDEIQNQEYKWGEQRISEDYPLGGMLEPYDIEKEKEFLRDADGE